MAKGAIFLLSGLFAFSLLFLVRYSSSYDQLYRELESKKLELENTETQIQKLKSRLADARAANQVEVLGDSSTHPHEPKRKSSSAESARMTSAQNEEAETETEKRERIASIQVAAVGRVLSLSPDEEDALEGMYLEEQTELVPSQSLADIVGEERAQTVFAEQRKAFSRSELEDVERDAYYFSRKFELSDTQELQTLNALTEVQDRIKQQRKESEAGTPQARMQQILEETRLYRQLLLDRMQKILNEKQLGQYIQYDQESSAADMELWHSPPEE